jgi:hypothetical protein
MWQSIRRATPMTWLAGCFCLAFASLAAGQQASFAGASGAGDRPALERSLQQHDAESSRGRLLRDMASAEHGDALERCLEVLAWDAAHNPLKNAPSPRPMALAELMRSLLPQGEIPTLKASGGVVLDWGKSLGATLAMALGQSLSDEQTRQVVSLAPLFVAPDRAATAGGVDALRRALELDARQPGQADAFSPNLYRRGLKFWLRAAWQRATERRRADLIMATLEAARQGANGADASAFLARWNESMSLAQWLARRPDRLERLLGDADPEFRQQVLALALRGRPVARLDAKRPATRAALIEALRDDDVPDNAEPASRQLAWGGRALIPALHKAFLASDDWQQITRLVALLTPYGDPAVQNDLAQFANDMLDADDEETFKFMNDPAWPGVQGQAQWAESALTRLGDPARRLLANRMLDATDERLARVMGRIIEKTGGLDASVFSPEFMRRLAKGLAPNAPPATRRACARLVAMARPDARKMIASNLRALASNVDAKRPLADDAVTAAQTKLARASNAPARRASAVE